MRLISTIKKIFFLLIILVVAISCDDKKSVSSEDNDNKMDGLEIPEDFDWSTTSDVTIKIGVTLVSESSLISSITVYNGNPSDSGSILQKFGVRSGNVFETKVTVPNDLSDLYITCTFPSGAKVVTMQNVTDKLVEYTFEENVNKKVYLKSVALSPDCTSGVDETISGSVSSIVIEAGKTVCLTGDLNGKIIFKGTGGTLRICGEAKVNSVKYEGAPAVAIEITDGGKLISTGAHFSDSTYTLINWGEFKTTSHVDLEGSFTNFGDAYITDISVLETGMLNNTSDLEVAANVKVSGDIQNSGGITIHGSINVFKGSKVVNNCQIMIDDNLNQFGFIENSGYIYVGGTTTTLQHSVIEMVDAAMIQTPRFVHYGSINGTVSASCVYVTNSTVIKGNSIVSGLIDICDENGVDVNDGFIAPSVTFCTAYIPITDCNPVGMMNPLNPDEDGDGVPLEQDDYPKDPYRAYNSFFPSALWSATYVFEDLWPSNGDYDFNDLVLRVFGTQVLNADNEVVELYINFEVMAVGAATRNGLGIQFDKLLPSDVQSVTGTVLRKDGSSYVVNGANGTELGQSNAVVILAEQVEDVLHRVGGSMFNTVDNGMIGTSDEFQVHILFGETTPVAMDKVYFSDYNVFLIAGDKRGTEIHLPDRRPTDLMTHELGLSCDTSNPMINRYYKTDKQLPWGLLTIEYFSYPLERVSIVDAYPGFSPWAQSGGMINRNWYRHPNKDKVWKY